MPSRRRTAHSISGLDMRRAGETRTALTQLPAASEGTGARSQISPGGQKTPVRTTADRSNHSMEQRSVFDLLQNDTGVKLPPVWYVVGARLLVWLGSRGQGASAQFVP